MTPADPATGIASIERIAREAFRSFGVLPNARVLEGDGLEGVITDVPITFFNGIAMSHVAHDRVESAIDLFRKQQRPFRWWFSPSSEPRDLIPLLEAQGMRHTWDSAGMMANLTKLRLESARPHELTIERVSDLATLKRFFDIFIDGFSRPPSEIPIWIGAYASLALDPTSRWTCFLGIVDNTPVATSAVLHCGDLAGIYHVVTLPGWRGRGIGAAMTRWAMRDAFESGAKHAALQASEMGVGVYRELGFVEYCQLSLYDWRPEDDRDRLTLEGSGS